MEGDEVFEVRKFCSLIVTEWAGFCANVRSGESTIQRLEDICAKGFVILTIVFLTRTATVDMALCMG